MRVSSKSLLVLLINATTHFLGLLTVSRAIAFDEVSSLHIWITVSSLATKEPGNSKSILFRQIELNWINAPLDDHDDYIALYLDIAPLSDDGDAEGGLEAAKPVSVHKLNGRMNGRLTTDYYLPLINFMNETTTTTTTTRSPARPTQPGRELDEREIEYDVEAPPMGLFEAGEAIRSDANDNTNDRWHQYNAYGTLARRPQQRHRKSIAGQKASALNEDECIGYCIAYHSQSRILASNCLKTHPNWMRDSQATMRSLPSLMIPGTHNSATYPRQLDKTALQIINKYQINQEESIFNQLVYGIRYLDLRVGHSKVKQRPEELWIYHDIFRTDVSVDEVFEQVARFLELTSDEIIVIDFHRFTVGFQNENLQIQRERHAKLLDLLFRRLGQYIIPSYLGQHAPLSEYISMGKRLIVGYASRSQLLGAQADQHSGMFGLYSAQASGKKSQQVRDIDADDNSDGSNSSDYNNEQQASDPQADRRMGTRIYNKLKSLKLISRQFSKRSIEGKEKQATSAGATKTKRLIITNNNNSNNNNQRHTNRLPVSLGAKVDEASAPLILAATDESGATRSLEEALASLTSRLALLFPPVRHLWPNKDTIEGLAQYMNETTCRKYFGELRSMMVELTPTVFGAISDKYDGTRRLADTANRPVTDWIRQRWLHCMNIVASDFFLGNDLIRLSIYANRMRLSNNHRRGRVDDLSSYGSQCKSFRRIEHLLDKSKIVGTKEYRNSRHNSEHNLSNFNQQLQPASNQNVHQPAIASDGFSDLFSFIKRFFNL